MKRPFCLLLIGWVACCQTASGAEGLIEWETDTLVRKPTREDESARAEFQFVNRGSEPLRVVAALPHCECTTVAFDPAPVPPGGRGTIAATLHFEHRSGPQEKGVSVYFDKYSSRPQTLMLRVELDDFYQRTPKFLTWDAKAPQRMRLTFPGMKPGSVSLVPLPEEYPFTAEVVPDGETTAMELVITPKLGAPSAIEAPLQIWLETEADLPRLRSIPLEVRPAEK